MNKKRDAGRLVADVCFIAGMLVIFSMGILIGTKVFPEKIQEIVYLKGEEQSATLNVPGVDQYGNGVMTELTATLNSGSGQMLVNVNNILAGYELQVYARNAMHAVENVTGKSLKNYDVSFSMKTGAGIVDGGSASAAMAVAVMAMREGVELSKETAMTGAVDETGKILAVGLVDKKAEAAKMANLSLLVVPAGQGGQIELAKTENCNEALCEISYAPLIGGTSLIPIKEVSDLREALNAMSETGAEKIIRESRSIVRFDTEKREYKSLSEFGVNLEDYSPADVVLSGTNIFVKVGCKAVPAVTTGEQADSIVKGIYHKIIGRPNMHDTAADLLNAFGIEIIAATIDSYDAGYFRGRVFALDDGKLVSIDAKPSDAVALGSRLDSPLYINNKVLTEKGISVC
ncbi:MAG: DUF151 domain-containing protein [Candidatus Nanoarchaeia archaeon]|nr:DUF151 domain-containing protein [Candidatus Nanoarchaeia archaeon]